MNQPLEAFTLAIQTGDDEQRRTIAGELGRHGRAGDPRVIPILLSLLGDQGFGVNEAAIDALQSIGASALPALVSLLGDRNMPWEERRAAAEVLGHIGTPRAGHAIATVLLDETEPLMLRRLVAAPLGWIKTDEAFEALVTVLSDPTVPALIRAQATAGLGNMRDTRAFEPLAAVLGQEDVRFMTPERKRELQRLRERPASTPANTGDWLREMIARVERGHSLHDGVLHALRELHDPRTVDLLLPMLGIDDEELQVAVAAAIGSVGEPALLPLLEALRSDDGRTRTGAATALGFQESARATRPLTALLLHDPDVRARRAAANSLGFIKDEQVAASLIEGLRDEDVYVRLASAQALYQRALTGSADVAALPELRSVAEHDQSAIHGSYPVREAAARAIREILRGSGGGGV